MVNVTIVCPCRFAQEMAHDSRFELGKFVVKLNHTSGSHYGSYVKFATGVDGILEMITELTNNKDIFGFYSEVLIIPRIPRNTQASIVLFNGKAVLQNPLKKGTDHRSPFSGATQSQFYTFAEEIVGDIKRVCPALISDNVMRVDFHGVIHGGKLHFLVNSIEGNCVILAFRELIFVC